MLRKRSRSLQKEQHHMVHMTNSDANLDHHSHQFLVLGRNNTHQSHSIFNPPCLFVGLGPKGLLDADSVRSPTSPLDARVLSNLGNHVRTPRSTSSSQSQSHSHPHEGHQRSWDCCKVGLSLIDSLEDCSKFSGKILRSSESKNICLSPKMMIKTPNFPTYVDDSFESSKSLPKDFCKAPRVPNGPGLFHKGESSVLFEIGDSGLDHEIYGKTRSCSLDSCSPLKTLSGLTSSNTDDPISDDFALKDFSTIQLMSSPPHFIGGSKNSNTSTTVELSSSNTVSIGSSSEFMKSLSASEIELSEDYTCVISHGPNPKTTHIFGDCILETHSNEFIKNHLKNEEKDKGVSLVSNRLHAPIHYPSSEFLSFCHHCNKKLEEGKDIYIYRGEKAFCTLTCRALEIMNDEELEESNNTPSENSSSKHEVGELIFETGILTTT